MKLHIRPSEWVDMDDEEKAFICASIDVKVAQEKKTRKEMESKSRHR